MKIHLLVRLEEMLVEREAEAQRKREEVRRERERQEQERLEEMAAAEESVNPHPNLPATLPASVWLMRALQTE
jgi:hypothetical protein